jgi:uncharacterized protein (DUF433 family)
MTTKPDDTARKVEDRAIRRAHWEQHIGKYPLLEIHPGVNHGRPTFKGTRIPAYVAVAFTAGVNAPGLELLRVAYPLTDEMIEQGVLFALDIMGGST